MSNLALPAVRYVSSADGMNIAYLDEGQGRTIVSLPFHHSHLERRWISGGFPGWLRPLAETDRLITYDSRGQGLSTRNLLHDPSVADYRRDLEAVLSSAGANSTDAERFVLVAYGGFAHVAIQYAVDNPQLVEGIVLICTSESFSSWPVAGMLALAAENWDLLLELEAARSEESFRERWLSFLRASATGLDYARLVRAFSQSNVTDLLPRLGVPVLILHSLDQHWLSVEEGTRFAAKVPGARLVLLNGDAEPNDIEGVRAIKAFLQELPRTHNRAWPDADGLSTREGQVLHLLATGMSNQRIADELVISLNTVRRHVSNIFDKTDVNNRAQAAVYARDHGWLDSQ